jgi:hypothetical protein
MIVGGVWYLGPGDSSSEIRRIKAFMRTKFRSYAGHLADTELYDQQMFDAVSEMQRRYGLPVNGLIGYSTKVRMGYLVIPPPRKPTLITLNGAAVDMWTGPQADIARAVQDLYYWQPIGFDSRPIPMAPGVAQARAEIGVQLDRHPGPFSIVAYSEGALAASKFYKYDLLAGAYRHRLGDLKKVVMIGNPYRELNVVWDVDGNPARPGTQGISDDRIVNTPPFWREIAHHGDIYAENTVDNAGEFKTSIYKAVQGQFFGGSDSLLHQIMELVGNPFSEGFAMAKAIISGIGFFGTQTREHINYPTRQAIDYLRAA